MRNGLKKRRSTLMVSAAILVSTFPVVASAHSGYISCSSSYDVVLTTIGYEDAGTHSQGFRGGYLSAWKPAGVYWANIWTSSQSGFWNASAPNPHNGWAECL